MEAVPDPTTRDSATTQPSHPSAGSDWGSLRLLNSYRLFVAVALLSAFLAGIPGRQFGTSAPAVFYTLCAVYVVAGLVFTLAIQQRRPAHSLQAHVHLYTDILVLAGATYASGGMPSGLATLMVVPIAGAGTLLALREALFLAALGTLLVLGGEFARHLEVGAASAAYPQAAVVGLTLFAAAVLAAALARRSHQSAELARRRSEDVRRLSALNERIVQQMEAGILVVGPSGAIELANASAGALLDRPARLVGQSLGAIAPGLVTALETWQRTDQLPREPLVAHERSERRLQVQFTPLGEAGTLIALEDAGFIEEQVQQLKLASLGRLTASIAHEIRNPLAAISHSTQLLAESSALERDDQRLTEIVLAHCRRVDAIVDNVLELSRRPRGTLASLELGAWLADFVEGFVAEQALAPGRLRYEPPAGPIRVHFDTRQLEQIVRNLCENSLRHGRREDGESVTITLATDEDRGGWPCLDVCDDGEPIARERVDTLFEPFYTTSHTGTGLGLFLARELCESNGARLRFVQGESGNIFQICFQPASDTPSRHE